MNEMHRSRSEWMQGKIWNLFRKSQSVDGPNNKWHKGNQVNVCYYNCFSSSGGSNRISSALIKLDVSDCSVHSFSPKHTNSDTAWNPHGFLSGVNFMDSQLDFFSLDFRSLMLHLLLNGNGTCLSSASDFQFYFRRKRNPHKTNGH